MRWEAFEERTGKDAERLDELALPGEATIDPWTGKPLMLKKTDNGWMIYSVWTNGADDGGIFLEQQDWGISPPADLPGD